MNRVSSRKDSTVKHRGPGRGISLVEVIVTIVVIGLLMAILLPAISSVRQSVRRMQCGYQFNQIGIALSQYEDIHKQFPPSGEANTRWSVCLLPFLEQSQVYSEYDHNYPPDHNDNLGVSHRLISVLKCPSDRSVRTETGAAFISKAMNILLADKSTVDCTDGASNTILLSEVNGLGDIPWTTGALTFVGYQESSHGHMVNVLFADGHVAFVDGRNEQVMTAWGTPSGGEF